MDEQQVVEQPQDPTQPVAEQTTETPQETSQETPPVEAPPVVPAPAVDAEQDFINAYEDLCKQKGKQFKFQLIYNTNDDGSFDTTSSILQRLVVDLQ